MAREMEWALETDEMQDVFDTALHHFDSALDKEKIENAF